VIWHDGPGGCLFTKRLERGRFISYGLVNRFEHSFPTAPLGRGYFRCIQSARVRTPSVLDGRSDSYAGIGYPMMTVRRRAASLRPRT
jgi:hypothetical protein